MSRVVPVAYFAYRRADLVARTLAALRANSVPLIHAFSDGARGDADRADVAEVRQILRAIDWAEVKIVERPANLGVDVAVPLGITETLAEYDEIVVCEDDIELAPGAYQYFLDALDRYRSEPRVMCIGAWTHPRMTPRDARSAPHFTGRFGNWGWATWRRAWAGFDPAARDQLRDRCAAREIDIAKYGDDVAAPFRGHGSAHASWDFAFSMHMMAHDGLTLMPPRTMSAHIGYDSRATHPQDGTEWVDRPESPPPSASIRWPAVEENPASAELWRRALETQPPPSVVARIRRRLARMFGASAPRKA